MNPTVRAAGAADAPAIAPLLAELGYPASAADLTVRLESLHRADEIVLVAEVDGELLGVETVHITPMLQRPTPVGRITMLVVAQRAHGKGIGRALVEAAEKIIAARGCSLIEITSNRARTDAHAFYERLGYEITSVRLKKELPWP